ncbi:MAG: alpha/beta hydrolase [Thermoanaerobaculia bacterium]
MEPKHLETTLSVRVPLRLLAAGATEGPRPAPILIGMHGYGQDADSLLPVLLQVAPPGSLVLSLEGPESAYLEGANTSVSKRGFHWGVSTRADDNRAVHRACVAEAISWAGAHGGDSSRVLLFGFSQPCSFNYRLALAPPHGVSFRAIVAICGGIPGEWTSSERGTSASHETDVLHVSTREDEIYSLEKIAPYRERLAARFRSATLSLYDGGHRVPSASRGEVRAFLAAHE